MKAAKDETPFEPQPDPWAPLKTFTAARIALGRTGTAPPLKAILAFTLAHAHARDAVYSSLQTIPLAEGLAPFQLPVCMLHSQAAGRQQYLQRPDLGRKLDDASVENLLKQDKRPADIVLMLADGLSATAINLHGIALLKNLVPLLQAARFSLAPLCIVQQGRVAIGDETGALLGAKLTVMLIGERPGLSAADSIGAYITYAPTAGNTDEKRNCISNIRPDGLPLDAAAQKITYLCTEALRLRLSGVQLKDNEAAFSSLQGPSVNKPEQE